MEEMQSTESEKESKTMEAAFIVLWNDNETMEEEVVNALTHLYELIDEKKNYDEVLSSAETLLLRKTREVSSKATKSSTWRENSLEVLVVKWRNQEEENQKTLLINWLVDSTIRIMRKRTTIGSNTRIKGFVLLSRIANNKKNQPYIASQLSTLIYMLADEKMKSKQMEMACEMLLTAMNNDDYNAVEIFATMLNFHFEMCQGFERLELIVRIIIAKSFNNLAGGGEDCYAKIHANGIRLLARIYDGRKDRLLQYNHLVDGSRQEVLEKALDLAFDVIHKENFSPWRRDAVALVERLTFAIDKNEQPLTQVEIDHNRTILKRLDEIIELVETESIGSDTMMTALNLLLRICAPQNVEVKECARNGEMNQRVYNLIVKIVKGAAGGNSECRARAVEVFRLLFLQWIQIHKNEHEMEEEEEMLGLLLRVVNEESMMSLAKYSALRTLCEVFAKLNPRTQENVMRDQLPHFTAMLVGSEQVCESREEKKQILDANRGEMLNLFVCELHCLESQSALLCEVIDANFAGFSQLLKQGDIQSKIRECGFAILQSVKWNQTATSAQFLLKAYDCVLSILQSTSGKIIPGPRNQPIAELTVLHSFANNNAENLKLLGKRIDLVFEIIKSAHRSNFARVGTGGLSLLVKLASERENHQKLMAHVSDVKKFAMQRVEVGDLCGKLLCEMVSDEGTAELFLCNELGFFLEVGFGANSQLVSEVVVLPLLLSLAKHRKLQRPLMKAAFPLLYYFAKNPHHMRNAYHVLFSILTRLMDEARNQTKVVDCFFEVGVAREWTPFMERVASVAEEQKRKLLLMCVVRKIPKDVLSFVGSFLLYGDRAARLVEWWLVKQHYE